jgi:hypothetical protein
MMGIGQAQREAADAWKERGRVNLRDAKGAMGGEKMHVRLM